MTTSPHIGQGSISIFPILDDNSLIVFTTDFTIALTSSFSLSPSEESLLMSSDDSPRE